MISLAGNNILLNGCSGKSIYLSCVTIFVQKRYRPITLVILTTYKVDYQYYFREFIEIILLN